MSVFRSALTKEWHAHRRTLLILFLLLACMAPLLFLFYPAERIGYREFSFRLGIVGMAVVLVTFAPGLLSQERADVLARRLPRSLAATFWARILLYVVVQGAAVLWCLALGEALRLFVPERLRLEAVRFWQPVATFWLLNVGLGFWVMLVGCWLRSAILALPGAALLLAILILPLYLAYDVSRLLLPASGEIMVLAGLFLLMPLVAANTSYVRGLRFVVKPKAPAFVGAATLMVLILPLWGWTGVRTWRHLHIDPCDPDVAISSVLVGPHGRSAYVTLWRPGPGGGESPDPWPYALRVDLEDGSWKRRGGRGSYWENVGFADRSSWATGYAGLHRVVCRVVVGGSLRFVDGASGELLREAPMWHWDQDLATLIRDTKRAVTPWRDTTGGPAWVMGHCWWNDGPGGTVPLKPIFRSGAEARWSTFLQHLIVDDHPTPRMIFDPFRGRAFEEPSLQDLRVRAVRCGRWLVSLTPRRGGTPTFSENRWRLMDPESGAIGAACGLEAGDWVSAVLDDGDLLVRRRDGEKRLGRLLRVCPESGESHPLIIDGSAERSIGGLLDRSENLTPVRTPDGRRVFELTADGDGTQRSFVRLEEDGRSLTSARGWTGEGREALHSWVIACPDDDTILVVLEQRTIERLHFDSAERELLFPRPSP